MALISLDCIRSRPFINILNASIAGLLFFVGWWLLIDVNCSYPDVIKAKAFYYVPGVVGSVAFFVVNSVPNSVIAGDSYAYSKKCTVHCGRFVVFIGLFMTFGALIAASYIWINDFLMHYSTKLQWPGTGIALQNILIFTSTFLFRFGIIKDEF